MGLRGHPHDPVEDWEKDKGRLGPFTQGDSKIPEEMGIPDKCIFQVADRHFYDNEVEEADILIHRESFYNNSITTPWEKG